MTNLKHKNKHLQRQRLSNLLCNGVGILDNASEGEWLGAYAADEGVDLLLWPTDEDPEGVDPALLSSIRLRQSEYELWHLRMKNALRHILRGLNSANIPVVILRGLALSTQLYEQPYMRPQSDIDLIVENSHVLLTKQVLSELGFKPDRIYSNIFTRGNIQIDIHIEPLGIERIRAWEHLTPLRAHDFFEHATEGELVGEKTLIIPHRINLPFLCFHAMKHSFERLIWLYDIALMANQIGEQEQWDDVMDSIQTYKLERPCFYALSYASEHLGAKVPSKLLLDLQPEMNFIERRLFKRHMNHEVIPFLAERLFSRMQPTFKHSLIFWKETIYPSYEVRKQMSNGGCVKCSFIRTRLKQVLKAGKWFLFEGKALFRS